MLVAQKFEGMRSEVDEHENASRTQRAGRLGDRSCGPIGVMQDLMNDYRIKGSIR